MNSAGKEYEQRRLANIQRNRERMVAAGLLGFSAQLFGQRAPRQPDAKTQKARKPAPSSDRRAGASKKQVHLSGMGGVRRSARLQVKVAVNYEETTTKAEIQPNSEKLTTLHRSIPLTLAHMTTQDIKQEGASDTFKTEDSGKYNGASTKDTAAELELLATKIGQWFEPSGGQVKGAVVDAAVGNKFRLKFNKMSGIMEWANCIFLFVNVGQSDYDNVFYFAKEGNQDKVEPQHLSDDPTDAAIAVMTWFAQATQHPDSPVIKRIQSAAVPVLLFLRPSTLNRYVCCGELARIGQDSSRRPMQFWFVLKQWEILRQSEGWGHIAESAGLK